MAIDALTPRSRRGLLVSATAAAGAALAAIVGRPLAARAGNPPVLLGVSGQSTATSTEVVSTGGDGLDGTATSSAGIGVLGYNSSATGETFGVMGRQHSLNDGSAVFGLADNGGTGVFGKTGAIFVPSVAKTGVYGRATQAADPAARGVWGESDSGSGLYGKTTSGYALETVGRLKIGTSGLASIPAGQTSVSVPAGVNVTGGSSVLLTPRTNLGGRDLWFSLDAPTDAIVIRMSSQRPTATLVAWLLLG